MTTLLLILCGKIFQIKKESCIGSINRNRPDPWFRLDRVDPDFFSLRIGLTFLALGSVMFWYLCVGCRLNWFFKGNPDMHIYVIGTVADYFLIILLKCRLIFVRFGIELDLGLSILVSFQVLVWKFFCRFESGLGLNILVSFQVLGWQLFDGFESDFKQNFWFCVGFDPNHARNWESKGSRIFSLCTEKKVSYK